MAEEERSPKAAASQLWVLFLMTAERMGVLGSKTGGYRDSKNNISILDHLPEATTNCRSEWNVSLGIHGQEIVSFFSPLFWKVEY